MALRMKGYKNHLGYFSEKMFLGVISIDFVTIDLGWGQAKIV